MTPSPDTALIEAMKGAGQLRQLIDQAREKHARTWTADGWRAEQSLDHPGYWDVWTMDATGERRIILARFLTANTAALMCFVSTALPQLCDGMDCLADALSRRVEGEGWQPIETAPRVLWQPVWLYWIQGNQPVLGFWEEPDVRRGETVGCWNVVERDSWYTNDKFAGWQEVVRPLTPSASSSGEG